MEAAAASKLKSYVSQIEVLKATVNGLEAEIAVAADKSAQVQEVKTSGGASQHPALTLSEVAASPVLYVAAFLLSFAIAIVVVCYFFHPAQAQLKRTKEDHKQMLGHLEAAQGS